MTNIELAGCALVGMAAGATMIPLTRHQLMAAVARADSAVVPKRPAMTCWQWLAVVATSGLLPAVVWRAVGGSLAALPPLLLVLGLIQLAYCDATRRLLPKNLVYGVTAVVLISGITIAWHTGEWDRLRVACEGGAAFFAVLFVMNLINPKWMAFGDVRLSLGVGFGLAWIGLSALVEGFFIANVLAAVVGVTLMALRRADRKSALPFGLYLAIGTAITIVAWS
ncbi:MAG TPA: A24 family peptidase [Acidimicrobiales bacterium]